ncbi:MAG TPA: glycosyltransferase [Thiotrichaceae bacterium]|jgi:GT2 family glycosyltransferase|nr:glycosyltransferase [Thiotrichaceae bacterium]
MTASKNIIAICVATHKRNSMLNNCLSSIKLIELPEDYKTIVIIMDNDVKESARVTVEEASVNSPIPIYYYVAAERGISSARNHLLTKALNHESDLIAFIDDDEFPKKNWLLKLLSALKQYRADVATGPVISLTEEGINISTTEKKYLTGQQPRKVSTNNVLFKNKLIKEDQLDFDLALNFTGGEDFDFFSRSQSKGNVHVWIDSAIVYETIAKERTAKKYLFFRHFTGGINNVIQYKINNGLFLSWLHFLLKATGKVIGAILAMVSYLLTFNKKTLEKSMIKFASAVGYICGLLNIIVERYR